MPLDTIEDVLIDEVRLWDGAGGAPRDGVDLLLSGGVITAIADEIAPGPGTRILDGAGLTAIPGLIDSHVHLSLDQPGAIIDTTAPPPPPGTPPSSHPFLAASCGGDAGLCSRAGTLLRGSETLDAFLEALGAEGWQVIEQP